MTQADLFVTALLSLMPISELRGAIPYAIARGADPVFAYFYSVFFNILAAPVFFVFISTFHRLMSRIRWYYALFDRLVIRSRAKIEKKIEKYGYIGIILFVAIPLPVTGAYTGTMGAWVLGLGRKKTIAAVAAGVAIAGIIVSAVVLLGIETFSFFVKQVSD